MASLINKPAKELMRNAGAFFWQIGLKKDRICLDENFQFVSGKSEDFEISVSEFEQYIDSGFLDLFRDLLQKIRSKKQTHFSIAIQLINFEDLAINVRLNGSLDTSNNQQISGLGLYTGSKKEENRHAFDYKRIYESCDEGIIIANNKDKIIEANISALRMLECEPHELKDLTTGYLFKSLNQAHQHSAQEQKIDYNTVSKNTDCNIHAVKYKTYANETKYFRINKKQLKNDLYHAYFIDDRTNEKQAEDKSIQQSLILQNAPVAIAFTDFDGHIQYVNPAFSKITGYRPDNIKNKKTNILKSGIHDRLFYAELWNTIKSGKKWEGKLRNKKKNGDLYWEKAIIVPYFDENKEISGFIKVAEDITQQVETKQKLAESEIRYRDVFETAGVGIIYTNKESRILDTNKKFNDLLGIKGESLKNKSAIELINRLPRPIAKKLLSLLFHILKGNKIKVREIEIFNRFYEIQSDYNPLLQSNIGIIRDITDKKLAKQKLQESEAKYRYLVENMNDGLATSDSNENINFMNPAAEKIFEVKPHETGDLKLIDIATENSKELVLYEMEQRRLGKSSTYFIEVITPKGNKKYLEIAGSPIYDDEENFNGSFAIIRDITEKLQAELEIKSANSQLKSINKKLQEHATELELAKEKAEQSERLKSAFLANISHEIRTPMNGIVGFAQLAMNSSLGEDKRNSYLQIVSDSTMQLESVVMDIIDLSKIESGETKFSKKTTDIQEILDGIYEFYAADAKGKNLSFNLYINDSLPKIKTDPVRFKQAIKILTHNALKFTAEGSVSIEVYLHKTTLEIKIIDTGIGIPKEYHNAIFEPFRQVELALKRRFGGTGLGLTIAREIAKHLNGEITLESEPGQGSTFYFRHPLS